MWETYEIHTFKDNENEVSADKEYALSTLQKIPKNSPSHVYYRVDPERPETNDKSYHKFKFYRRDSGLAGSSPWRWPFIDVTFFKEKDGVITNVPPPSARPKAAYPHYTFYPIVKRPLGEYTSTDRYYINTCHSLRPYVRSFNELNIYNN